MLKWVAEAQAELGHDVTVLVASLNRQEQIDMQQGVRVHKVPRLATVASTPITPTLPFAIRRYKPDIAHVHSPYPPGELFNYLFGRAKFSVMTYHSDVVRQQTLLKFYKPLFKRVLNRIDVIMPTSANYIESSSFIRSHKHKCRVVPLGIDLCRFDTPPSALAQTLKEIHGSPLVLFVGRLRYYKGIDTLIDAMSHVNKGKALIVGDGPLRAELEAHVNRLNLSGHVHFAGDVSNDDLPAYFQAADCFVLPSNSRAEAFGIVLLEAMASGLPCISTELETGTSWVVQDGITGFVVPPQNSSELAQAINTMLGDNVLRRKMAQASLKRVHANFSKEKMVNNIMQIYEELLKGVYYAKKN